MYFEKRYLQFNDLVFDGVDMISDYDETLQFKGSSIAYSYGHGSYMPLEDDYLYVSERPANMTLTLKLNKLPCEYREDYVRFAIQELSKPGKLWAIRGNEILWANARVNNLRPVNQNKQNIVVFDIEYLIPGGAWYKADKQRTFLLPYELCGLMECKGFAQYNSVVSSRGGSKSYCEPCEDNKFVQRMAEECVCCSCDEITADMALGFHLNELQAFYGCDTPYQLVYDCVAAESFNLNPAFGQRICVDDICDDTVIAGQIYSETDIPTKEVSIVLMGDAKDPQITINDNTNIIKGEYHGKLTINASGDVYYTENECCDAELLNPSVWDIPANMNYGWMIYPKFNKVIVETNICCSSSGTACIYVDHSPITM